MTYQEVLNTYNVEKELNSFRYLVKDRETGKVMGYIDGMAVLKDNRGKAEANIILY
jgi:hypothetical protein